MQKLAQCNKHLISRNRWNWPCLSFMYGKLLPFACTCIFIRRYSGVWRDRQQCLFPSLTLNTEKPNWARTVERAGFTTVPLKMTRGALGCKYRASQDSGEAAQMSWASRRKQPIMSRRGLPGAVRCSDHVCSVALGPRPDVKRGGEGQVHRAGGQSWSGSERAAWRRYVQMWVQLILCAPR